MEVRDPRLLKILSPKIERVAAVYEQGYAPGLTAYWQTRPYDERIAAVLSTVGVMTDMQLTLDMLEFVGFLNAHGVRYLVVGGYALGFHGHPRFTKDLDIWIERTPENGESLAQAMADFGVPVSDEEVAAFVNGGPIRIGRPPNLIDVIGHPHGVTFSEAYPARETTTFEGLKIDFISRVDLIENKRATGRMQDLADIEQLGPDE